jgi:hypothetical protein
MLLALARDLGARATRLSDARALRASIDAVAAAYGPDAPLAGLLRRDWLRGRTDKNSRLALAWAREQVRLALVDVLRGAARNGLIPEAADADSVAWFWLAGAEALAHEPPSAVADRALTLAALLGAK